MMIKRKIYFCTYADSKKYDISAKHLIKMTKKSGLFSSSVIYTQNDLDVEFKQRFSETLSQSRGGGYWLWKHHVIEKELKKAKENDFIVYSDAGSSFNYHAVKRFNEYIEMLNNSDYGTFRIEGLKSHLEKYYTKKEIFDYFDLEPEGSQGNTVQYMGGHLIFQKNDHTYEFLKELRKIIEYKVEFITDFHNKEIQIEEFIENRHDQSLMSIISKLVGTASVKNETYFEKNSNKQYDYPFLSVRNYGQGLRDRSSFYLKMKKYREPIYF